jgi:hypothetical protein
MLKFVLEKQVIVPWIVSWSRTSKIKGLAQFGLNPFFILLPFCYHFMKKRLNLCGKMLKRLSFLIPAIALFPPSSILLLVAQAEGVWGTAPFASVHKWWLDLNQPA